MKTSYACKRAYMTDDKIIEFLKKTSKFVGEAIFTDYVFKSEDIDKDLFWVRHIKKNSWPTMKIGKFYPFIKTKIRWSSDFQLFEMPIGNPLVECSSLEEAKNKLPKGLVLWFSFNRTTHEYKLWNLSIYIENVDFIQKTIEVVCNDKNNSLEKNMEFVDGFFKEHDITATIPHQVATLVKNKIIQ